MALNKKQKKQLEVAKTKKRSLEQLLAAAKKQMDDQAEIPRLQKELAAIDQQIRAIQEGP